MMINKKRLTERDICTKFITPAKKNAGWDRLTHFLEEVYFTEGRMKANKEHLGRM
ncbi:MAG: hypothetical protein PHO32_07655 [Candidatus Cloacimonetes bacterium]|nr:hypothetical protein [Candidatus Cloacimonadota bacterium]